jgi:UDP-N-acetyl-D-mannosaminuronate dehydrogenase
VEKEGCFDLKKKNVIAGLGEIGLPIYKIVSKATTTFGFDLNPELIKKNKITKFEQLKTSFLHICIPYNTKFIENVIKLTKKFEPEGIVIHSTVSPYTTKKLQERLPIPVIYSATRGIHKRMINDLKRYTKFYAIEPKAPKAKWASNNYSKLMKECGIKTKKMSNPITLELAKIVVDTSYYGWLINYAQLSNMIANQHKVNFEEMWSFADEIQKYLGNRPKMYPGIIGGHCVIPNLDLIHNETLNLIDKINNIYRKKAKNLKKIEKKHVKGKQSYDK